MKALIIGATGQDGSLLCEHLVNEGLEVHGTHRRGSSDKFWRINELGIRDKVVFHNYNVGNELAFSEILKSVQPEYIFSLAGESFTALSFDEPKQFLTVNIESVVEQLEAIRAYSADSKVFFAGSSEVFGESPSTVKLNEKSKFHPKTPYGVSKVTQYHLVQLYREKYKLKLYTGILFPHESPYRSPEFVTRKIAVGLVHRKFATANALSLGDISMSRDWGSASDFVRWMYELVKEGEPGEYILGTGINTLVEEFLLHCASALDLNLLRVDSGVPGITQFIDQQTNKIYVEADVHKFGANRFSYGSADVSKLDETLPNRPRTPISDLAKSMVEAEVRRLRYLG